MGKGLVSHRRDGLKAWTLQLQCGLVGFNDCYHKIQQRRLRAEAAALAHRQVALVSCGLLEVLRDDAAFAESARCFLFFLRIVRSPRTISLSDTEDLVEPLRLSEAKWKGEPERKDERSELRARLKRVGREPGLRSGAECGPGDAGRSGGSSSRMVVRRARRSDCRARRGPRRAPRPCA
ncbi:jg22031 [Pararge aegeria aegeria]|uniref:Jg22031 protein n=1 Tax=Pararge aegeria aegeria TaxID=348720 RepID=A0A8S4RG04_9NEOP|nr:jg22031 [Pararge aegeria aegeria]